MSDESVVKDLLLQLIDTTTKMQLVQAEIRAVGEATLAQALRTNGRVDKLEMWQQAIDTRIAKEQGMAEGRKLQRSDDMALFSWAWEQAVEWRMELFAAVLLLGSGAAIWEWLR